MVVDCPSRWAHHGNKFAGADWKLTPARAGPRFRAVDLSHAGGNSSSGSGGGVLVGSWVGVLICLPFNTLHKACWVTWTERISVSLPWWIRVADGDRDGFPSCTTQTRGLFRAAEDFRARIPDSCWAAQEG